MKEFIESRESLKIIDISRSEVLTIMSPLFQIQAALKQAVRLGEECSIALAELNKYVEEYDSVIRNIFSAIEEKHLYIENYCNNLTARSLSIPHNTEGYIHIFNDSEIDLKNMSKYGTGYILEPK